MAKSHNKKLLFGWVLLAFMFVISAIGFIFLWNGSLFGAKLPEFTKVEVQTFTPLSPISESEMTPQQAEIQAARETQEPSPPSARSVCGQKAPMTILLLGIDENEQADVIRLVRVDFLQKRILVLSIPRDFWVPVPGLDEHGITRYKINATYGFGEYYNGKGQGVVKFSETIFANYGVTFDRYAVFHFSDFEKMVDAVGGVDINLDGYVGGYNLTGYHHLDGKAAREFAQMRDADNDDFRIDRQSLVIGSLFQKLTQPDNLLTLPHLGLKILQEKTVISDFSLRDVVTFTCLAKQLDGGSLVLKDIPGELFTASSSNGLYIRIPSPGAATYIQDLILNGNY